MAITAIIYARVSTEEQARHGYSLPDQLASCRAKAIACGSTRLIECVDEGVTGEVLNRPGLEKARSLVRAGGISLFVALDPDRLARKLSLQLLITEEFDRARVQIEFVNFEWRDTAEGRLFYSLRGAIAEFEKEKIRERVMRGKLQKARQGLLSNNPHTYGYTYNNGKLIIEPHRAALVRLIFSWFVKEGLTYYAIAQRLNEMGIASPGGGIWQKPTVRRILANTTYIGRLYANKHDTSGKVANRYLPKEQRHKVSLRPESEWVIIQVPPIVDESTFCAAQLRLARARMLRPGRATQPYLLSGVIQCGVCGAPMHGLATTNSVKREYRYYACATRASGRIGQSRCTNRLHQAAELEEAVWHTVIGWLSDVDAWVEAMETANRDTRADERAALVQQLAKITAERERLLDVLQRGLVGLEEVEARLSDLRARENKAHMYLASLQEAAAGRRPADTSTPAKQVDNLMGLLRSCDNTEKKALIRVIIDRVEVSPEEIVVMPKSPMAQME